MTHLSSSSSQAPSSTSSQDLSSPHDQILQHPAHLAPPVAIPETARSSNAKNMPTELPAHWQYESAVETVESIIKRIESGEMELATIFDQFAIAVEHLQACESFLQYHRQQVDVLVETLNDEAHF